MVQTKDLSAVRVCRIHSDDASLTEFKFKLCELPSADHLFLNQLYKVF